MSNYRSKRWEILAIDMLAIAISFIIAIRIRYNLLVANLGSHLIVTTYVVFFFCALLLYTVVFLVKSSPRIERQSYREIVFQVFERQIVYIAAYVMFFFIFHQMEVVSRIFVGIFFICNMLLSGLGRILYHEYCVKVSVKPRNVEEAKANVHTKAHKANKYDKQHVFILGSKSIGQYGGFEYFVMNLLKNHKDNASIKYHVACKANGDGHMDINKLPGAVRINDNEFSYCNAHCFMINVPNKIGSAQAVFYDLRALKWACEHIEKNHISHPIVYILACRIGPFEKKYIERIHDAGGLVYQNPDGHEHLRRKWNYFIRQYWKISERLAVKYADLVICDSKCIEKYIQDEYASDKLKTTYIAYGAQNLTATLKDDDIKYVNWLINHDLSDKKYYISVGRFAPENNFDIMIREFMRSNTENDFAIITTDNPKYAQELRQKLQYTEDSRIKFVGTVYEPELIYKIRANAVGYIHGHEVGGTNPSLLEALGSTKVNLLYDVEFNREVAQDAALYWTKDEGSLAELIDKVDDMTTRKINEMGKKARARIADGYGWDYICEQYENVFVQG